VRNGKNETAHKGSSNTSTGIGKKYKGGIRAVGGAVTKKKKLQTISLNKGSSNGGKKYNREKHEGAKFKKVRLED